MSVEDENVEGNQAQAKSQKMLKKNFRTYP
jgi:hypothetical protein